MFHRVNARSPEDFFTPALKRSPIGACCIRVNECSGDILDWIWRCHEAAAGKGVILDGGLNNPTELQLSYYRNILGDEFKPERDFILASLKKWIPAMQERVRDDLAAAMAGEIGLLRRAGKPEGMIRNIYIKWMCWLYYSFGRMIPFLGQAELPKVLIFGGGLTSHALIMLKIVCAVGADILMVDLSSGSRAQKTGSGGEIFQTLDVPGGKPFPPDMTLKKLRAAHAPAAVRTVRKGDDPPGARSETAARGPVPRRDGGRTAPARRTAPGKTAAAPMERPLPGKQPARKAVPPLDPAGRPVPAKAPAADAKRSAIPAERPVPAKVPAAAQRPVPPQAPAKRPGPAAQGRTVPKRIDPEDRFPRPARRECTNAWMEKAALDAVLTRPAARGEDPRFFYNAFVRMTGVNDRLTYPGEIHALYRSLAENGRTVMVLDGALSEPLPAEIDAIRRRSYKTPDEMIVDLAANLPQVPQAELQREIQSAFVRAMKTAVGGEKNLNRLTVRAVTLLCWIRRWHGDIFRGWKETELPAVIKMGGCENDAEALYFLYLSLLPADVVILSPDLDRPCVLRDDRLLEIRCEQSMRTMPFPKTGGSLEMGTVAAYAEEDLTKMLYSDSGIYRSRQFDRAEIITLKTTYDEIFILWDQELKFRPNFAARDGVVGVPVLYAKVSGVKNGKLAPYWQKIRELKDAEDTLFYDRFPLISPQESGKFQSLAQKGLRRGRICRDELRAAGDFPFELLRTGMQDHIFDKLQLMLDRRIIKGTFETGAEYAVLSTVLGVGKDILRAIQDFDFTGRNPKVLLVSTRDVAHTLEDAILLTFLSEIGFDVVMFVPTGYQLIERYLNDHYPVEHQIGEFVYDLEVPDMNTPSPAKALSWLNNLLKRGD